MLRVRFRLCVPEPQQKTRIKRKEVLPGKANAAFLRVNKHSATPLRCKPFPPLSVRAVPSHDKSRSEIGESSVRWNIHSDAISSEIVKLSRPATGLTIAYNCSFRQTPVFDQNNKVVNTDKLSIRPYDTTRSGRCLCRFSRPKS